MVTRERLVSTALGGSAVGMFALSVLGFLDRIEMGRVAAGLLAVGAVVATIATFRSENDQIPTRGDVRSGSSAGRVIALAMIMMTLAAVAYLVFVAFEKRDFTF
jgi:hypothetical protein